MVIAPKKHQLDEYDIVLLGRQVAHLLDSLNSNIFIFFFKVSILLIGYQNISHMSQQTDQCMQPDKPADITLGYV